MSNEEMVKEAVEEAKKAAEAEAKEQKAKGQEPEETEATEEEAVGKETNSEDAEEPKKKKLFEKKNKKDKNIEEEIKEVLQYLKEENVKIPEKYKIDFNKKYKYIIKIDDHDDSKLYLIYISDEKRIYIVENIY